MNISSKNYETSDLNLTAYLIIKEHRVINHYRYEEVVYFVFNTSDELLKDVNDFFFGEPTVSVKSYNGLLKDLKSIIFNR